MKLNPSWKNDSREAPQNCRNLMELEDPTPYSQGLYTAPYPEPYQRGALFHPISVGPS
jgi:hypothetical protein